MRPIQIIRMRLGVSQQQLAEALGCTQANVSNYERGQTIPPEMARKLIAHAKAKGLDYLTWDHVYGAVPMPPLRALV